MAGTRAGVEVEGGPQLRRAFRRLGDRCGDLRAIHDDVGELVAEHAEDLAPRLSGRLAESTRSRPTKARAQVTAGGRGIPYAGPIHFGWRARNIEPQPFLYDALDDRRRQVVETYATGIGRLVDRFELEAPR